MLSFLTPQAPAVTTIAAGSVGGTSANLQGTGNPRGATATGWFRYSTANPGTCNDTFGTRSPGAGGTALGAGTSAVAFNNVAAGLTPGATYFFCAIASNSQGTAFGSVLSFSTPLAPAVNTLPASGVGGASATLEGNATPGGAATTGWFRYSATAPSACNDAFGTRIPAAGGFALGSGGAPVGFQQLLSGLTPGTLYTFCALASNSQGTSFGALLTFSIPGPNGGACSGPGQCASGQCVDGVCCNTVCNGGCFACDLPGTVGTCTPRPNGVDPEAVCGSGTCGGACNGAGACSYPTISCGVCQVCNGAGTCVAAANGASCADAAFCNGEEKCNLGACAAATPVVCADLGREPATCDEPTDSCVPDPRVPPLIAKDANLRTAVGARYVYNAAGAVTVRGSQTLTFGVCGGPSGFRVDPQSGAVTFTPQQAAELPLCVFAQNANGRDEYTFVLSIVVPPPGATGPTAVIALSPPDGSSILDVQRDGSGSFGTTAPVMAYRWQFADSRPVASGPTGPSRFVLPGSYQTQLTVVDELGLFGSQMASVSARDLQGNRPPLARIIATQQPSAGGVTVSLSCDCGRGDAPLAAFQWTISDGRTLSDPAETITLPPGRYHVLLEVVDENGLSGFDKIEVAVDLEDRKPPECALALDPPAAIGPTNVSHSALFADVDGNVVSTQLTAGNASTSTANLVTGYTVPGHYPVQLRVTDDEGLTCTDVAFVRIAAAGGVEAPRILSRAATEASCGSPFIYSNSAPIPSVAGARPLTWSVEDAPEGFDVDEATGLIFWTPARGQMGRHSVTLRVVNEAGSATEQLQIDVTCASVPFGIGCGCSEAGGELFALTALAMMVAAVRRRRVSPAAKME
ncbi:MAG: putative Ig domain-containing protein [Myxococcaceae bacterium]